MIAIQTSEISKMYGETTALHDITLTVDDGKIFGLIGPDGAGKTTLIRILTSLIYPDGGEARVLSLDPLTDYRSLRQKLGYMPGRFSLYQDLSVEENLELFASIYKTTIQSNYYLIEDIYRQIEPFKKRRAGALSGGMKQKLALCCAMIHKPNILFLDEPTTGVDPVSRREFWDMLAKLNEDGLTIFVSTPYMDEALRCDEIALIQNGTLLAVEKPEEIKRLHKKSLYSISGENKYELIKCIRTYQDYGTIYSFGTELHYTHGADDFQEKSLEEFLRRNGHSSNVKKIEPTIEDTFIALMTVSDERTRSNS